jgi:hypothetical protein
MRTYIGAYSSNALSTSDAFQLHVDLPFKLQTTIEVNKQSSIADVIKEVN